MHPRGAGHPKRSRGVLHQGPRLRYAFIRDHRGEHRIATMCRVLGVTRSGFYAWLRFPVSDRAKEDARLVGLIRGFHAESGGVYGSLRIFRDLREAGETCGLNRVARLMRQHRIKAVRGYKAPRRRVGRASAIVPNRLQWEFVTTQPDQVWVTDITYIRTWEGWLYLAVVVDLYSRRVVGWSMQKSLNRSLAIDALLMALQRRRPKGEVLVHSDQGSQYGSDDWMRFCKAHGLEPSMSRCGNCWDNAVAESFFSSLKKERIRKHIYHTRDEARADVFDYIEMFYYPKRRHSYLGDVSPEAYEASNQPR